MVIASRAWEQMRPWPVYVMAAALPVSIALTNLAKALVLLAALVALVQAAWRREWPAALRQLRTPLAVALLMAASALSLTYTSAASDDAWHALGKHAKLLLIPLALLLLRTREQARTALLAFLAVQCFVLLSSWLLGLGVPVPWAREDRNSAATVFSSRLDQSMLTALAAVLLWHLRSTFSAPRARWAAVGLALLAILNVLFLLPGRSGQLAVLSAVALIVWWALPGRWRWAALVAPVALAWAAYTASPMFRERAVEVVVESRTFLQGRYEPTSSGQRLLFWSSSLQSMRDSPLYGHGVGSWNREFHRQVPSTLDPTLHALRNPHQEYLLWGVETGVLGMGLLIGFFVAAAHDASRFPRPVRHATQATALLVATLCLVNAALFDAVTGETFALLIGILLAWGLGERAAAAAAAHAPANAAPETAALRQAA